MRFKQSKTIGSVAYIFQDVQKNCKNEWPFAKITDKTDLLDTFYLRWIEKIAKCFKMLIIYYYLKSHTAITRAWKLILTGVSSHWLSQHSGASGNTPLSVLWLTELRHNQICTVCPTTNTWPFSRKGHWLYTILP